MQGALILLFYVALSLPGLFAWWFMHHALEPRLSWAIPAPRLPELYHEVQINSRTDWRGFT